MAVWKVIHYNHGGTALGETFPIEPEFEIGLGSQIDFINYGMNISEELAHRTTLQPYVTDFMLKRDDLELMGGLHTAVEHAPGSSMIQVSGLEWLHWLERRISSWPHAFGYAVYQHPSTDICQVARNLVQLSLLEPNTYTGSFTALPADQIVPLTWANPFPTAGRSIAFRLEWGSIETIYAQILQLSQQSPGFDFKVTPQKEFKAYPPFKGETSLVILESGINITNVRITDEGVRANNIVGLGSGLGIRMMGTSGIQSDGQVDWQGPVRDTASMNANRRMDLSEDFGEVTDQVSLNGLTYASLYKNASPFLQVEFDIIGEKLDFWGELSTGDVVKVRAEDEYDIVDDYFRIITIKCKVSRQGDERISLTLDSPTPDQINPPHPFR